MTATPKATRNAPSATAASTRAGDGATLPLLLALRPANHPRRRVAASASVRSEAGSSPSHVRASRPSVPSFRMRVSAVFTAATSSPLPRARATTRPRPPGIRPATGPSSAPWPRRNRPASIAGTTRRVARAGAQLLAQAVDARREERRGLGSDDCRDGSRLVARPERAEHVSAQGRDRPRPRQVAPQHDDGVVRQVRVAQHGRRARSRSRARSRRERAASGRARRRGASQPDAARRTGRRARRAVERGAEQARLEATGEHDLSAAHDARVQGRVAKAERDDEAHAWAGRRRRSAVSATPPPAPQAAPRTTAQTAITRNARRFRMRRSRRLLMPVPGGRRPAFPSWRRRTSTARRGPSSAHSRARRDTRAHTRTRGRRSRP